MQNNLLNKMVPVLLITFLISGCLKKPDDIISDDVSMENLVISDPSIWNSLAMQTISMDDLSIVEDIKSAKLKEYPGGNKYYYALFEDLFPSEGDYDFNDVVLKTKLYMGSDKKKCIGKLETTLVHTGGSMASKIGLMFYSTDGKNTYQRIANEDIEINGVPLIKGGKPYTFSLADIGTEDYSWDIYFSFAAEKIKYVWIGYFLVTQKDDDVNEILTAGFPTAERTEKFEIPTSDYLTHDNKPWGLEIEAEEMPIVKEKENFCSAFPDFINWTKDSDDKEYKKWYANPDENFIQATK